MDYYTLPFIFGEDEFQAIADLLFPLGVAIGTPNTWRIRITVLGPDLFQHDLQFLDYSSFITTYSYLETPSARNLQRLNERLAVVALQRFAAQLDRDLRASGLLPIEDETPTSL